MPNKTYLLPGEPERLLRLRGNSALLGLPSVAIVGSRKVSLKGLDAARDCAAQLARAGVNVVSGYARGVDLASHIAALEAGGTTTLVLAEGLNQWKIKADIKGVWNWDRALVVSEFDDGATWSKEKAFQRNGTVIRLSRAVIVAEAARISGTMNTVRQCLKRRIPLFAVEYDNMEDFAQGNAEAIRLGAQRLLKSRLSRRARLDDVLGMVLREHHDRVTGFLILTRSEEPYAQISRTKTARVQSPRPPHECLAGWQEDATDSGLDSLCFPHAGQFRHDAQRHLGLLHLRGILPWASGLDIQFGNGRRHFAGCRCAGTLRGRMRLPAGQSHHG